MPFVYSTQFVKGVQAGGILANIVTVPAGRVYVLRDMSLTPLDVAAAIYQVKVGGVTIDSRFAAGQFITIRWAGRVVLKAGDVVTLGTGGVLGWEFILSGYDLRQ